MAGLLGLAASIVLYLVAHRLIRWPAAAAGDFSKFPAITIFATLLMSAIVAGFSEEAGFRGYMQGPLEHRYGPASAILITSVIFGLVHLSHGFSSQRFSSTWAGSLLRVAGMEKWVDCSSACAPFRR